MVTAPRTSGHGGRPLPDDAPEKWIYHAHTQAKHRLLQRYLQGFLAILANAAERRREPSIKLMIVDSFAGRGRYEGGEQGSPLVIADVADEVARYFAAQQRRATRVEIDCSFVESDHDNYVALRDEVLARRANIHTNVTLHDPKEATFANAIGPHLQAAVRANAPIFVFVDPNGWAGVPMAAMKEILALEKAEVFITFMVRDIKRFFEQSDRDESFRQLFGIGPLELDALRHRLRTRKNPEAELLDEYMQRLKSHAGATHTFPFRVMHERNRETIYYLVHAATHPRALRLMKKVMKEEGAGGHYTFFGPDDFGRRHQLALIPVGDEPRLKMHLLSKYAGRTVVYDPFLLNDLAADDEAYYFVDSDIKRLLQELRAEGKVNFIRDRQDSKFALRPGDQVQFPRAVPAVQPKLIF